jgi:hypothetical protein
VGVLASLLQCRVPFRQRDTRYRRQTIGSGASCYYLTNVHLWSTIPSTIGRPSPTCLFEGFVRRAGDSGPGVPRRELRRARQSELAGLLRVFDHPFAGHRPSL